MGNPITFICTRIHVWRARRLWLFTFREAMKRGCGASYAIHQAHEAACAYMDGFSHSRRSAFSVKKVAEATNHG